jgi:mono/diheme cytochrome c family protein
VIIPLLRGAALIVALAGSAWAVLPAKPASTQLSSDSASAAVPAAQGTERELRVRGQYLATVANCIACHSTPGSAQLAGGRAMETPLGKVYATNITPHPTAGIGAYSRDEFARAVREGVTRAGINLYPAMPYPSYAGMSDADIDALYAYLQDDVAPVASTTPDPEIPWLLRMRWPIAIWNWLFVDKQPYQADSSQSAEWNRGAYLTQAVAHCGACHTPRNVVAAERALDEGSSLYLAGARVDGWSAPNLTGDQLTGLGAWSREAIAEYLRTGRNAHATSFGPMSEVISSGTQFLTSADALAIATYLKSLPGARGEKVPFKYDPTVTHELTQGRLDRPGARRYAEYCMACHGVDGKGFTRVFPPLAGNAVVLDPDPVSLIRLLQDGAVTANVATAPAEYHMPAYGWTLDDQELANILSFIRSSWGNQASVVEAGEVARYRTAPAQPASKQ